MTWARFDDSFPEHPKVIGLSADAFRLHVTAICYSARTLTDGVIQQASLRVIGANKKLATELVDAQLWDLHQLGYAVHDYLDYNPSRDHVLAEREKRSAAGKAGANSRWQSKSDGSGHNKSHGTPHANRTNISDAPVPSRPGPSGSIDPSDVAPKRRYITPEVLSTLAGEFPEHDVNRARDDYLNYGPNRKHIDQVRGLRNQLSDPERSWRFLKEPRNGRNDRGNVADASRGTAKVGPFAAFHATARAVGEDE